MGSQINADRETIVLLQHMILSHHYEPEFGSPKRPMIPEGNTALPGYDGCPHADMQKALEAVKPGESL